MGKNEKMNDELVKVNDGEMDNVAGGIFGLDDDAPDGHEKSCFQAFHFEGECSKSSDGYHYWADGPIVPCCKYCKISMINGD